MQISYSFFNHWWDKKCLKNQARERRTSIQSTVTAMFGTEMDVIWLGWVHFFCTDHDNMYLTEPQANMQWIILLINQGFSRRWSHHDDIEDGSDDGLS